MKRDDLLAVMADLDRIDAAGETENLCEEVAYQLRGRPSNPLDAMTIGVQLRVDRLASEAARLLRLSTRETRSVAMELYGVASQERMIVNVIHDFAAQLGGDVQPLKTQPSPSFRPPRPVTVNVRRPRKGGRYGH